MAPITPQFTLPQALHGFRAILLSANRLFTLTFPGRQHIREEQVELTIHFIDKINESPLPQDPALQAAASNILQEAASDVHSAVNGIYDHLQVYDDAHDRVSITLAAVLRHDINVLLEALGPLER